jgi:hypothetical protein
VPRHLKKSLARRGFFYCLVLLPDGRLAPGPVRNRRESVVYFPKTEAVTGKFCVTQTLSRSRESRKTGRFFSIWYLRTKGKEA